MKIPKTEKEFRSLVGAAGNVHLASALIVALDLEFKEEEPELPERVGVEEGKTFPCLIDPDAKMALGLAGRAVVREAAARYNAWEILYQRARKEWPHTTLVAMGRHLAEERERLQ